jgi:protein involved in polysaccharide export with SLBB domain
MSRKAILLFLTAVTLGATGGHAQTSVIEDAVLRPGDAVLLTVWRNPELSGEFMLAEDGSITHPLLRDVRVMGVPLSVAEARVREMLEGLSSNPQFVLQPLLRVSVGGEVRQPSLYRLPPGTSIAEAVALAGGATERGQLHRVRLVRGETEIRVDLVDPKSGWAQRPIRSGDQIFVERRVSIVREYLAPAGSITAALVSLINVLTRL